MPYWGANVRHDNFVVQAKIHGEKCVSPDPDDLIEFISNLTKTLKAPEDCLAKFFAEKIATAYKGYPDALWVTVDILTTEGRTFGDTCLIEENENHEPARL